MEYRTEPEIRRAASAFCEEKKHGSITKLAREAGLVRQTVARFIGGEPAEDATIEAIGKALKNLAFTAKPVDTHPPTELESESRFEIIGAKMIAVGKSLRSQEFSLDEKTRELEFFIKHTARSLGILDNIGND